MEILPSFYLFQGDFFGKALFYNTLRLKVIPGIRRVKNAVTFILKGVYFKLKSDSEPKDVTFTVLQCRLLGILRHRINNGEFTERSLARLVGISQPQVHNVLKGVRKLSPQTADLLLGTLKMTILDLLTQTELPGGCAHCSPERSCGVVGTVTGKAGAPAFLPASAYPLKKGPSKEIIPYFPPVERLG